MDKNLHKRLMSILGAVSLVLSASAREIVPAPIQTPWDSLVDPSNVLPEYPRPQLVRAEWQNLNGRWNYAITSAEAAQPAEWTGQIVVPFCFESELSGVNRIIDPAEWMWYQRTFEVPADWSDQRIWLNFEACDWETVVYVNGKKVGCHRNGYTPFSFDITDALKGHGKQELVVRVWDHSATKFFTSGGKQSTKQDVYEASSGIWQTVWLEPRSAGAIASLKINASLKKSAVSVVLETDGKSTEGTQAKVEVFDGDKLVATQVGSPDSELIVHVPNPKAWAPNSPFLYDLQISLI
jgi:beta-galactosidase/beta-glucuronidase